MPRNDGFLGRRPSWHCNALVSVILHMCAGQGPPPQLSPSLCRPGAVFATLTLAGLRLRPACGGGHWCSCPSGGPVASRGPSLKLTPAKLAPSGATDQPDPSTTLARRPALN
jgi:hypothetical protein